MEQHFIYSNKETVFREGDMKPEYCEFFQATGLMTQGCPAGLNLVVEERMNDCPDDCPIVKQDARITKLERRIGKYRTEQLIYQDIVKKLEKEIKELKKPPAH